MAPMFGWMRHRRHAANVHQRFVTETVEALYALHRRVWEIEKQMQQHQATSRELERHVARAEAEASVVRLELREIVREHELAGELSVETHRSRELLEDLLPVPATARLQSVADVHSYFFPTPEGYELVEVPGMVPTVGSVVDLGEHGCGEVAKVGRSPLPNDARRCVYLLPITVSADRSSMPEEESESLALVGSR